MQIRRAFKLLLLFILIIPSPVSANQSEGKPILLPIGGEYLNISASTEAAIANAKNGNVNILVLPIAMASNAITISPGERQELTKYADIHRAEIQENCKLNAREDFKCNVLLMPVFTRSDARNPSNLIYFNNPLSAIFILDGSPTIAMDVIGGTALELSLTEAFQQGVLITGTGAGGVVQASSMIGGYNPGFNAENSLEFGAPDMWNSAEKHGLLFGIQAAVLDDRLFQDNHFGRLLNAITIPDSPSVGIGIDMNTAADITSNMQIDNVSGTGVVAVLDASTYHAANTVRYIGTEHFLSIRNVLVNLLSSGNYSYDLTSNQSSLQAPAPQIKRSYDAFTLPNGAGPLWLTGELQGSLEGNQVLERFVKASGGARGNILIVATGYPSETIAQNTAIEFAQALKANSSIYILHQTTAPEMALQGYTGIILIGGEQSLIAPQALLPFKNAWLSGVPLLAENAAAAVAGEFYTIDPSITGSIYMVKKIDVASRLEDANIRPGLGLLMLTLQPGVLNDNLWGSVFSLSYNHPELINLGLNDQTAIEITKNGTTELGDNVVFVLDLRSATLAVGSNNGYVLANGLIDTYAPGESIEPRAADIEDSSEHLPTPDVATPTPTTPPTMTPRPSATPQPTGTATIQPTPTRRVKASPTPMIIPPPSDPGTRSMMVAFGVLIALLIAIGVWINRKQIL